MYTTAYLYMKSSSKHQGSRPFLSPLGPHLFSSFEDHLLHFHCIEKLVSFYSFRQRHDLVRHESNSTHFVRYVNRHQQRGTNRKEKEKERPTLTYADSFSRPPTLEETPTSQGIDPFGFSGFCHMHRFLPMESTKKLASYDTIK